jgi:hypothetical protein
VQRLHRVTELAAAGGDLDEVSDAVQRELSGLLDLERCRFERPPYLPMVARLERSGAISAEALHLASGGFALPRDGIELPVVGRGHEYGRLVLVPRAARGVSVEERVVAVALSDQLGAALAASSADA